MKDLSSIKEEIKSIKVNFNPEKSTYKILDDIANNNYDAKYIIKLLSRIKGVSKYPDDVKNKFTEIIKSLEEIVSLEDQKKKEEEAKALLKKKQEENTKELKDIIDSLEKRKFAENNENSKVDLAANKDNVNLNDKNEDVSVITENETLIEEENSNNKNFSSHAQIFSGKKLFFVLFTLVIIAIIILVLIFLFY